MSIKVRLSKPLRRRVNWYGAVASACEWLADTALFLLFAGSLTATAVLVVLWWDRLAYRWR